MLDEYQLEMKLECLEAWRLGSKALRVTTGSFPTERSDWKCINESVSLYLFTYHPSNFLSNMLAYALNRLQFFTGGLHYGLHASK
jgi:hypothetical protein